MHLHDCSGCTSREVPQQPDLVDLKSLWRAVPRAVEQDGALAPRRRVSATDSGPREVTAAPMPVSMALDGIQSSLVLTRRSYRPITIAYTAAGAMRWGALHGIALREHLSFFSSWMDEAYCRSLPGGVQEFVLLDEQDPAEVDAAAQAAIRAQRAQAEAEVAAALVLEDGEALVVDGSIAHLPPRDSGSVLGLIKTCRSAWLQDEQSDVPTRAGWRSGVFLIHGQRRHDHDRYSCYLRLHDVRPDAPWSLGLVRLEAHDPTLLDGFAAFVLTQRQGPGSGDPRWRRHAACIRHIEDMLRNRAPVHFTLR